MAIPADKTADAAFGGDNGAAAGDPSDGDLVKLAQKHGVDKWGTHWYARHYDHHFARFRYQKINLLEIGVGGYRDLAAGGDSLRMWEEYFPLATIYGIDIYDKRQHQRGRIKIYQGSQNDRKFLNELAREAGHFDIIIDDGSHINTHVITSFVELFPFLASNGIFVIEDVQTSYWPSFGGDSKNLNNPATILGYFKNIIDSLNYEERIAPGYQANYLDKHIVGMHFYHNLIMIDKGLNNEGSNLVKDNVLLLNPPPDMGVPPPDAVSGDRPRSASPEVAIKHFNDGNRLFYEGRLHEAAASYRAALALVPNHPAVHNNLGNALKELGDHTGAAASYRRALALDPNHYRAHFNLGMVLEAQGEFGEAVARYRRAIAIKPDYAKAYNNMAGRLRVQGRPSEAVAHYRRAAELAPDDRTIRGNMLFCLHYDPGMTPAAILAEHRAFCATLPVSAAGHANPRDPDKRLNIGYVSADLRRHPVGYFMMPVLAMHDRRNVKVHAYYNYGRTDGISEYLKGKCDVWRPIAGVADERVAEMIRADAIDILVDLAGHTAENRLPVFALRPAPVQATWAGYVGTTGLSAMHYLISDRWQSPPESERFTVEEVIRLPDGYVCWAAPSYAPEVGPLPATAPGAVTFGCFNNLAKLNPPVIALWGRLMRELPQSRLVLKTRELSDGAARERVLGLFAAEGIAAARIALKGWSEHTQLLRRYNDVDIALDPFPYSGGVTTIEALWMGVPVVTMPGERFASRHSLSHLSNVGLGELVGDGPEDYLRIAKALAHDLPRLAALRTGLRDRLRNSPLLQSKRFTRNLEAAFRAMWRRWCEEASSTK